MLVKTIAQIIGLIASAINITAIQVKDKKSLYLALSVLVKVTGGFLDVSVSSGDTDGIDSNGAKWYKINELHKKEVTPFVLYSLEKLGYKLH